METTSKQRRRTTQSQDLFNDLVHQYLGEDLGEQEARQLFHIAKGRLEGITRADVDKAKNVRYITLEIKFAVR